MDIKNWIHPAKQITIIETKEDSTHNIQAYIDRSKSEVGLGSGMAVFTGGKIKKKTMRYSKTLRCTNTQALTDGNFKSLRIHITTNRRKQNSSSVHREYNNTTTTTKPHTTYIHNRPNQEKCYRHGTGRIKE